MMQPTVRQDVENLLRRQGYLITRSQALTAGMTDDSLRHRLRDSGAWVAVLPGVYVAGTGLLAAGQRETAATLYAGSKSVITGYAALERHGVATPKHEYIDVLIPATAQRVSTSFVRTHRTGRIPEQLCLTDGLRWAPPARAVADAVRGEVDLAAARAVVASAVQRRKCTVAELITELRAAPTRGSKALRTVLEEVGDGVRSSAEGELRQWVKAARLPEPMYNPRLYLGSRFLAQPDAWWREAAVAGEVDSREWHLSPAQWEATMARHSRMSAQGIIVIHFTPSQLRSDSARIVAELRSAIAAGRNRPPLNIRAIPVS